MFIWFLVLGKIEGCSKSEQSRLQTPERKTADIKDKQASFRDVLKLHGVY